MSVVRHESYHSYLYMVMVDLNRKCAVNIVSINIIVREQC